MKHLFVPYPIAVMAKEAGFDEECYDGYHVDGSHVNYIEWAIPRTKSPSYTQKNSILAKNYMTAPLYQQLVDWLLVKHFISIEPYINTNLTWGIDFVPNVFKTHIGSGNFTFFTGYKKLTNDFQGYPTKYGAIEAGLLEAFKLIKK